jgi:hypothetical protein
MHVNCGGGRHERYRKRAGEEGTEESVLGPGFLDPITLECVVNPGISPFGHVMGMATWCTPNPLSLPAL